MIFLVPGPRPRDVIFVSGDPELQNAVADLALVKYPQTFPDETPVRVLRQATVTCSIYTRDCVVVLMPAAGAAVPSH